MSAVQNLIYRWWKYTLSRLSVKKDASIWLFGEWFGERCGDNCAYLANHIAANHPEIKLFWVAKRDCDTSILLPSIRVLEMGAEETKKVAENAGVVIVNQSFSDISEEGINTFARALTVNLWHGVMWKKIGHDGDKRKDSLLFRTYCSLLDPVQRAKRYLSPSEIYCEKMQSAFNIPANCFIRCGCPRNSLFYDPESISRCRSKILKLAALPENAVIVTYMPTFRDKGSRTVDLREIVNDAFEKYMCENNVFIIQKAHFVDENRADVSDTAGSSHIIDLNSVMAAELLAASDLLITDYSSCFFDYLILDRPIVHFLYDYDFYRNNDRGLYFDQEDVVCGDVAVTAEDLRNAVKENLCEPEKKKQRRNQIRERFLSYESRDSCEKLYQSIKVELKA